MTRTAVSVRPIAGAPERALAVGDIAVHRDAHRVDQHGFKLAPERQTMITVRFAVEFDSGALVVEALDCHGVECRRVPLGAV
jgi:hypothetical protein